MGKQKMQRIHVVGIAGTFMAGVARIAAQMGYEVSGCDHAIYPPMSGQLERMGARVVEGYGEDNVDKDVDLYLIGNAAKRGMPVVERILSDKLPFDSAPSWLGRNVLSRCRVAAVSGTHGKTTTTSMLAWILQSAGLELGFLVGGVPESFGVSARLPKRFGQAGESGRGAAALPPFVIEADEYDTAFFDKRSKFVHYRPDVLAVNNLEYDHADIFPDAAAIRRQFWMMLRAMPREAVTVFPAKAGLESLFEKDYWGGLLKVASPEGYEAKEWDPQSGRFRLFWRGVSVGAGRLPLSGAHNLSNALCAIGCAKQFGVSEPQALAALETFASVARRCELKYEDARFALYDDFAHHPTAIAATLGGLRAKRPGDEIVAVFEPRSNTMKMGTLKDNLAAAFSACDKAYCAQASAQWDVAAALAPLGGKAETLSGPDEIARAVGQGAERFAASAPSGKKMAVLVMSNGSFGGICDKLKAVLSAASASAQAL